MSSPWHVDALEGAVDRGVEHVRDAQTRLVGNLDTPELLEGLARCIVGDVAVTRQLVRERAHVAGALYIVLAAQRVNADARPADIAGDHREVGDRHDGGRALAVFGDAEAVIDRAVAAGGIEPCRPTHQFGRDAGIGLGRFRAVIGLSDEGCPVLIFRPVAAFADEGLVGEALRNDDMRQRRQNGNVGAGLQRQVIGCFDMRRAHDIGAARIDDDQLCALTQTLLQPRSKDWMAVRRVGADDHRNVGELDRIEVLRAGRGAEGLAEAVAGRRVADAGAGVDIVVAETGAHQLLHQIGLFVGAARRGDAADRIAAILILDAPELRGHMRIGLLPGHFAPGIGDLLADHRVEDAIPMVRVAIGKPALDAGMAAVGLAVLPRHHAHQFLAAHLRLERAADAAIGAGGDDGMLRLADLDHRLFRQRRRRAGLDAGAAGDAFRRHEVFGHACGNAAVETTAADRQRERALHFLAGAHAARADDAFRRIIGEVGVGFVLRHAIWR